MTDPAKELWDATYKKRKMVSPLDFTIKAYDYLKDHPQSSLLDVGCGDGRDALFFTEKNMHVTAIDFSQEAICKLMTKNPSIDARVMNMENMDFPDESFDAIYAHLSLHYFDDRTTDRIFLNIHRMLKPEGYFFVKCKSVHDPLFGKGEKIEEDMYLYEHQRHFFSREYLARKLRDFIVLEIAETAASYDGKESAFVEAMARKGQAE
ncbi:hypothetical protein COU80_02925 [Candidatus Peregrinibacteria bacterium CG10_big_fil_rev_8_21_14_0_10_55_24]|nr:MAG: hypothetical protein COU80_02925 [Candidatus Peregrinibacteria bacterium CG10_big_fil_rev_8_21_14_0_10_55_24]